MLEIGAGDRPFRPELEKRGWRGTYATMDVDPAQPQDFYSIEDVRGVYDAVILCEVVEHLTRDEFFRCMERIADVLTPGGVLALSTPNP